MRIPIDEEHPRYPISMYGVNKLSSESYAYAFYKTFGLPVSILRPFNIYGPGQRRGNQYSGVIGIFAERIMRGESPVIYGDGAQTRDFVHVSDVVEASVLAAESKKAIGQIFNVGTGKPTTINELAEKMIWISGKNLKPVHTKPRIGEIMHSVADISRIQNTLGYEPKMTLTQGLKKVRIVDAPRNFKSGLFRQRFCNLPEQNIMIKLWLLVKFTANIIYFLSIPENVFLSLGL
ncbi:MAG: NAD-dependent epimerase/dehydratase family protein [Candidatus Freyarchaeota archaeon]